MKPESLSDVDLLLHGLQQPLDIDEPRWERLLRIARTSGLHGRLAAANLERATMSDVVRRHLLSAARVAAYRAQLVRTEMFHLAEVCGDDIPVLLLKGGAYLAQGLKIASGRFVADIDLLVPEPALRTMEQRLRNAGWQPAALDAYDERYYRDWSHEVPPLRYPGRTLEVDLHHALTPVTGSLAFAAAPMFADSVAIPGTPFRALNDTDQVLHACLHCFHDGELDLRVREVVDIDGLLREFAEHPAFCDRLLDRARQLGLERPLWYGLHYAHHWLGCPLADEAKQRLRPPPAPLRRLMDVLVPLSMLPGDPDYPPSARVRLARTLLQARYHWLRMPPALLTSHLAHKAGRRLRAHFDRAKPADSGAL